MHVTSNTCIFKMQNFKITGSYNPSTPTSQLWNLTLPPGEVVGQVRFFPLKWGERINLTVCGASLPLGCVFLSTGAKLFGGVNHTFRDLRLMPTSSFIKVFMCRARAMCKQQHAGQKVKRYHIAYSYFHADDGGHDRPWPQNNLFSHSPIPRDLQCAAYRPSVTRFAHV